MMSERFVLEQIGVLLQVSRMVHKMSSVCGYSARERWMHVAQRQQWYGPVGAYRTGSFVKTAARCHVTDLEPNTACDGWAGQWSLQHGSSRTVVARPSAPSLYEFQSMDLLTTEDVMVGIGHHMQLPGVDFPTNDLPPVFILNLAMPFNERPNLMHGKKMHGKMLNVVLVYKLKQTTAEAANSHPNYAGSWNRSLQ